MSSVSLIHYNTFFKHLQLESGIRNWARGASLNNFSWKLEVKLSNQRNAISKQMPRGNALAGLGKWWLWGIGCSNTKLPSEMLLAEQFGPWKLHRHNRFVMLLWSQMLSLLGWIISKHPSWFSGLCGLHLNWGAIKTRTLCVLGAHISTRHEERKAKCQERHLGGFWPRKSHSKLQMTAANDSHCKTNSRSTKTNLTIFP